MTERQPNRVGTVVKIEGPVVWVLFEGDKDPTPTLSAALEQPAPAELERYWRRCDA